MNGSVYIYLDTNFPLHRDSERHMRPRRFKQTRYNKSSNVLEHTCLIVHTSLVPDSYSSVHFTVHFRQSAVMALVSAAF